MTGGREQDLMDMSVEELKAYKETIIEKIETHLPELCDDIDEVIALKLLHDEVIAMKEKK
jgi:hypothetical protein